MENKQIEMVRRCLINDNLRLNTDEMVATTGYWQMRAVDVKNNKQLEIKVLADANQTEQFIREIKLAEFFQTHKLYREQIRRVVKHNLEAFLAKTSRFLWIGYELWEDEVFNLKNKLKIENIYSIVLPQKLVVDVTMAPLQLKEADLKLFKAEVVLGDYEKQLYEIFSVNDVFLKRNKKQELNLVDFIYFLEKKLKIEDIYFKFLKVIDYFLNIIKKPTKTNNFFLIYGKLSANNIYFDKYQKPIFDDLGLASCTKNPLLSLVYNFAKLRSSFWYNQAFRASLDSNMKNLCDVNFPARFSSKNLKHTAGLAVVNLSIILGNLIFLKKLVNSHWLLDDRRVDLMIEELAKTLVLSQSLKK